MPANPPPGVSRSMLHTFTKIFHCALLVCMIIGFGCTRYSGDPAGDIRPNGPPSSLKDLPFGNPTGAHLGEKDNYLVERRSFTLSYNENRGTANWVAWHTTPADLGDRRERSRFEADRSLPNGMKKIEYWDYSGSGYDRGHMVPAADRFGSEELMEETFLMTNIVPQSRELNQYPWNQLENYARGIVRRGTAVYTIAGVYGESGRLRGKVTVPARCWKVIIILDKSEIGPATRTIAVDMPNVEGIRNRDWSEYITTIDEIEARAGVDLLSSLSPELQQTLETSPFRR